MALYFQALRSEEIPEENQEFDLANYHFKILKMNNKSVELVELVYEEPSTIDNLADKIGEV